MTINAFELVDFSLDLFLNLNGLKKSIIKIENYQIETWISKNTKPPLLLLHAFGVSGKYTWINQIITLSRNYKLIIPNLIFFGNSTMTEKSYSTANQVQAITLLLKHLNIKELAIGGASYGGTIACELAYKNEFTISKMFLSNSPIKNSKEKNWEPIMNQLNISDRAEILIPSSYKTLQKFFKLAMIKKQYLPNFVVKGMFNKYYLNQHIEKKKLINTYIEESSVLERHNYTFTFPILLIWGWKDCISPSYIAENLKNEIGSNVSIFKITNCGHLPHVEYVSIYNKEIKRFLKNC